MIKTEYLGYKLDEIYLGKEKWEAVYLAKDCIIGKGAKPESACADAQRKIQRKVQVAKWVDKKQS